MRILVVGDINIDVILSDSDGFPAPSPGSEVLVDDFSMTLGCASCITAAGLVKLGNEVTSVAKVGTDFAGDFCLERMKSLGLDISFVVRDPDVKTGISVALSSPEDRGHVSYLGATTALKEHEVLDKCLQGALHLHLSSYFLLHALRPDCLHLFRRAHEHGLTVSMDPCCDPASEWGGARLKEVLKEVDLLIPNEVELRGISGCSDPVEGLRALQNGRTQTVVKLGSSGALGLGDGGEPVRQAAPLIRTVDPTGAGDSFNAGFLHAWLRGRSLQEALRLGVACGSYSTLGLGGTAHQPTAEEAARFIHECMSEPEETEVSGQVRFKR